MKKAIFASILLLGVAASVPAFAHGVRFGFHFGFPVFAPYWYYPPPPVYYYPAPVTTVQIPPPTYVERSDAQATPPAPESYWYYCPASQTYFPYVKECSAEWQRVSPRPPGM